MSTHDAARRIPMNRAAYRTMPGNPTSCSTLFRKNGKMMPPVCNHQLCPRRKKDNKHPVLPKLLPAAAVPIARPRRRTNHWPEHTKLCQISKSVLPNEEYFQSLQYRCEDATSSNTIYYPLSQDDLIIFGAETGHAQGEDASNARRDHNDARSVRINHSPKKGSWEPHQG